MPEIVTICNTSPLLYLHLVQQLDLLPQLYGYVLIPPAVQAELDAGARQGVNVPMVGEPIIQALRSSGLWLADSLVVDVLRQAGEL
jgi:predicted nucleic acid-binding protein